MTLRKENETDTERKEMSHTEKEGHHKETVRWKDERELQRQRDME